MSETPTKPIIIVPLISSESVSEREGECKRTESEVRHDTRYKFLRFRGDRITSQSGECAWQIGEWHELTGDLSLCSYGFHCSEKPLDALSYVRGEIIAQVEVDGECLQDTDKEAWSRMRILEAWHWRKEDSIKLAIFAAEKVIHLYEVIYPLDKRPREAIEAAKRYLENPESDAYAARAAADAAAYAARTAAYAAADAAADAARAAADAAYAAADADAARAAAYADAARTAAYAAAARAAAYAGGDAAAARGKILDAINAWMEAHLAELERIGEVHNG